MKTLAAVLEELNKPLVLRELTIPPLKPGQVLVEMAYSGVCQTQILEVKGMKGADRFLPHTLGHEGSGKVIETGSEVKKVKVGDHVVLSWIKGSGADVPVAVYESDKGAVNSGAVSTFLTKTVVSENRVIKIDKDHPLKEAALLGCAIPTGAGLVLNEVAAKGGESIVILGIGGIGSSAVLAASHTGCHPIIAVDVSPTRLSLAEKLGATHTLLFDVIKLSQEIARITDGRMADYCLESAGRTETMEIGMDLIRNGGSFVIAGNIEKGKRIAIDPFALIAGKRIRGSWGGGGNPEEDLPAYQLLLDNKRNVINFLIGKTYPFQDINSALEMHLSGQSAGRVFVDLQSETS